MGRYIGYRLLLLVPVLLGSAIVVFFLIRLMPGDPAAVMLGQDASPQAVAELRHALRLDQPWPVQLGRYLIDLVRGDLGDSIFQHAPAAQLVTSHLPATIELAVAALLIGVVVGLPLGIAAAVRHGTLVDAAVMAIAQLGISLPVFWLAILLILAFAVNLQWLPAVGWGTALLPALGSAAHGDLQPLWDNVRHLLLPAATLGVGTIALISRMVRSSMLEVLQQDYVRTARSKGLPPRRVVLRHALRNALLPVVTVVGLQFGSLLGGAVVTESIFGWPGIGQLAVQSIGQRDYPLVQATVLITAVLFALVNLVVDLTYALVDPRIRYD